MFFYTTLIVILAALDQLFKYLSRIYLTPGRYVELIPNFIDLTYQENRGVSFSFLSDLPESVRTPLLVGISAVVIVGLYVYFYRNLPKLTIGERWGFALIMGGALGNFIDRAFRQQVTDYMFFHFYEHGFFINNLADDLISVGFVIVLIKSFSGDKTGKRKRQKS